MITVTQIEQAIQGRLKHQVPYLRVVGSLADFLTADLADAALLTPAAYVVFERGEISHGTMRMQSIDLTFAVIAVVANERGDEATRHGSGTVKGVYQVLDDIRAALTYQTVGLDIEPLMPTAMQAVTGTESLAVYGITFETRCEDTIN